MNPSWQQGKLRQFCREKGIHISAWSPLGSYKASWGSNAVMENPILVEMAAARRMTVAQVLSSSSPHNILGINARLVFSILKWLKLEIARLGNAYA